MEKQQALEKRVVESFASEVLDLNMKLEETETRLVNLDTMGAKMKNHLERIDEQLDAGRTESEMCTKVGIICLFYLPVIYGEHSLCAR